MKTMSTIESCALPSNALLDAYAKAGAYTDCFTTHISRRVALDQFVEAFYTTGLFKLERLILKWAVSHPSTDVQATQLAADKIDSFAAWRVEDRSENQLLMCDFRNRTRSWFMVEPEGNPGIPMTRLYFGSAVVPQKHSSTGKSAMGIISRSLLGFHRLYSVALLRAARSRLN